MNQTRVGRATSAPAHRHGLGLPAVQRGRLSLALFAVVPMVVPAVDGGEAAVSTAAEASAAEKEASLFDDIWSLATLYKNKDNPYVQEVKLRGRYQGQYHWLDSEQGDVDGWEDRRSRIGVDIKFLEQFAFRADAQSSDEFDPFYNGLVDFYLRWAPASAFSLTLGKQKPHIGHYDWLQSTTSQPTFERTQIFNHLNVDRTLGLTIDGKAGNWIYRAGVYSNENNKEFGQLDAGVAFSGGIGYAFSDAVSLQKAEWRFDWLHSDIKENSTVLARYENLFSTTLWLEDGRWGLVTEGFAGTGFSEDVFGFFVQPTYDLVADRLQFVGRYSYSSGDGPDSTRAQSRYERRAPNLTGGGRGETYNAFYAGLQYFIYGDRLKLMAGAEYADLDGGGNGGDFEGWTYLAGVRVFF